MSDRSADIAAIDPWCLTRNEVQLRIQIYSFGELWGSEMPKGYLIAHIRVQDIDGFEEFKRLSGAAIKAHGGKVLVRNPTPDHREGGAQGLAIVIEFENLDAARAFYESDAYGEARRVREKISETDLILAEGL